MNVKQKTHIPEGRFVVARLFFTQDYIVSCSKPHHGNAPAHGAGPDNRNWATMGVRLAPGSCRGHDEKGRSKGAQHCADICPGTGALFLTAFLSRRRCSWKSVHVRSMARRYQ